MNTTNTDQTPKRDPFARIEAHTTPISPFQYYTPERLETKESLQARRTNALQTNNYLIQKPLSCRINSLDIKVTLTGTDLNDSDKVRTTCEKASGNHCIRISINSSQELDSLITFLEDDDNYDNFVNIKEIDATAIGIDDLEKMKKVNRLILKQPLTPFGDSFLLMDRRLFSLYEFKFNRAVFMQYYEEGAPYCILNF